MSVGFEPLIAELPVPAILLGLLFAMGGVIGSFLNVVVYRLPAGLSVVRPRSRCPKCGTPILPFDNIPILGWIKLRGRCRACREPISRRYPLVELATAIIFVAIGWFEPLASGANLPQLVAGETPAALAPLQLQTANQFWALYGYHMVLVCGLLCAALIEYDGHGLPMRLVGPVLAVGACAPFWAPWLHPLPANLEMAARLHGQGWMLGLVDSAAGGLAGMSCGLLASQATELGPAGRRGSIVGVTTSGWTGLFLGWQAGVGCGLAAAIVFCLAVVYRPMWRGFKRLPFAGCLLAAVVIWIPCWRAITTYDERLGVIADAWTLGGCGLGVLGLSGVAWLFGRRRLD